MWTLFPKELGPPNPMDWLDRFSRAGAFSLEPLSHNSSSHARHSRQAPWRACSTTSLAASPRPALTRHRLAAILVSALNVPRFCATALSPPWKLPNEASWLTLHRRRLRRLLPGRRSISGTHPGNVGTNDVQPFWRVRDPAALHKMVQCPRAPQLVRVQDRGTHPLGHGRCPASPSLWRQLESQEG